MYNQRLELTWVGKGEEIEVEPRILLCDAEKGYGDPAANNMLIHGDNLLALKALEQCYSHKVKCIYIDPPYNTGNAFEHYDDSLEHSIWLSLMYQRITLLRTLLSEDGVIIIECDKCEDSYLKVICDEIFGRKNFVNSITVQSSTPSGTKLAHRTKTILKTKDTLLIYKKAEVIEIRPQYVPTDNLTNFNYWLEKNESGYCIKNLKNVLIENSIIKEGKSIEDYKLSTDPLFESFVLENRNRIFRKQPSLPEEIKKQSKEHPEVIIEYFDEKGHCFLAQNGYRFAFLSSSVRLYNGKEKVTQLLCDIWTDISFHGTQYEGTVSFPAGKKPEALVQRIFEMFTQPGDLVLDSFLGSGTTAAVAHKMGRRWIGIELGEHCYTHCKPRLDKVIDGEQGGISKAVNWNGGGGYKFYELAPTLVVQDKHGNPIFSEQYSPEMLVQAVAKVCGYHYAPDAKTAWKQAYSQDNSFLFVTTQYFTAAVLDEIAQELSEWEHLLVCAPAFDVGLNQRYENISVRKIPQAVLDKCKYGVDNYNLNIIDPPQIDEEEWDNAE